jgi:photosystem II stability/assembly factor-like uncharacterized protein/subtilisin-like proprotein convertase family protein
MKKLLFTLHFAFCILYFTFSQQPGWRWQHPYLQGNDLNSIIMSGTTGWAVGDMGVVMKTSNSGLDWEIVDLKTARDLNCIYLDIISGRGWIVGNDGSIWYTEDSGEHWVKQNSGTGQNLYSITASGGDCPWVSGNDVVLHSADHGETWEKINTPVHTYFWEIDMKDCDEIWVCGNQSLVMSTKDHGASWQKHTVPTTFNLLGIDIVANGDYRACGNQVTIIRSSDGGDTWVNENQAPYISLYAIDTKGIVGPAYAVGDKGHIYETLDGGTTWTDKSSPTYYQLNDICFQALYHAVYCAGWYGQVLRKDEPAGTEFEVLNKQPTHRMMDMDFINADTGWVVGGERIDDDGNIDGVIMLTVDGGESWEILKNQPVSFNSVDFINANEGWAVGSSGIPFDEGVIMHTTNGGQTWTSQSNPIIESVDKVFFLDENNGWVVSNDWWGQIAHTTNGGQTWIAQTNPTKNPIVDVFFINPDKGWAVGMDSTILRTTNGGQTWLRTDLTVSNNWYFRSVFFIDEMHGWAVGVYGVIMLTNDGGITWQEVVNGIGESLQSVFFIDPMNGWAVGDAGTILRSIDGGYTWFEQFSGIRRNFLCSVQFTDLNNGWISGEGGTIKHTENGGFWNEPGTYINNNLALVIPDLGVVTDTLTIETSGLKNSTYQVTSLEVMIDSILHTRAADLEITLSHQGVTATLLNQVSDSGHDFLWTRFTDEASTLITNGKSPFSGNYKPYQPLTAFNGLNPDGAWILTVHDKASGNTGTLYAWGIKPVFEKVVGMQDPYPASDEPLFQLGQNVPNPFSGNSVIHWSSNVSGITTLKLIHVSGQLVTTLVDKYMPSGNYSVELESAGLKPGVYYYQLTINGQQKTRKCILME